MKADQSTADAAALLRRMGRLERFSKQRTLWKGLHSALSDAKPYRALKSILTYFRRFRAVSVTVRLIGWIFAVLQTGALVLLTTAILSVLIPLTLLLSVMALLAAIPDSRKSLKLLSGLENTRAYVFFSAGRFGTEAARRLAAEERITVFVMQPFRVTDLQKRRFFLNLRADGERFFYIRHHFYPKLRRKILKKSNTVLVF